MIEKEMTGVILNTAVTGPVRVPVRVGLTYDEINDPYAVQAVFADSAADGDDIHWTFSRDSMYQGVAASGVFSVGSGNVRFKLEPALGALVCCLRSPEGHADIGLPLGDVQSFLDACTQAVPLGRESVEDALDSFIEEVLEG